MDLRSTAIVVLLLACGERAAAQSPDSPWKFNGFGTLGVARGDTDKVGFRRESGQLLTIQDRPTAKVDSRLGLQASYVFTPALEATVQVLTKYGTLGKVQPEFNWAFLKWNPVGSLQVRVGRLGAEGPLVSDSRDVGYSYVFLRPPAELYTQSNPVRVDGVDITDTFLLGGATTLRLRAMAGYGTEQWPLVGNGQGQQLDFRGSTSFALNCDLENGPWRARLAYLRTRFKKEWPSVVQQLPIDLVGLGLVLNEPVLLRAAQQLSAQGLEPLAGSAAVTYASDGLMVEAEVNHLSSNRPFQPTTWAGGLTVGYHLGQVAPYVVFARASSKVNPPIDLGTLPSIPAMQKYPAAVTYLMALNVKDQSTVSLGVRWDWAPNVALKGQVDRIHAHHSEAMWASYQPGWGGNATIVSVCLDFVFGGGHR